MLPFYIFKYWNTGKAPRGQGVHVGQRGIVAPGNKVGGMDFSSSQAENKSPLHERGFFCVGSLSCRL